jgi:mannobiose 2-epimerase
MNEKKSMNNHLHVLEAYTNLYRVWKEPRVAARLRELIELFLTRILDAQTNHFHHFFDEQWQVRSDTYTFGHDIEGSWLLCEAAEVLGDANLLSRVRAIAIKIAQAVYAEGLDHDGGLFYKQEPGGHIDTGKHWWPQAEAVVGFLNAYELSGEQHFLQAAEQSWAFIEAHIVDRKHGEWFSLVSREGVPDASREKVGPWKCPYHNSRTCFEVMERLDRLAGLAEAEMENVSEKA